MFESRVKPFFLLLILTIPLYFTALGAHPLMEPDEGRYSEVPREMIATGDWITPRLNGVKYFEKPILHYWLTALSFKLFGEGEFAARFTPAALALAGVALTYAFALPRGNRAAFLSGAILATSSLWLIMGQLNTTDMSLTFFLTVAFVGFWWGMKKDRRWLLAGYAGMALAFLTKGLIGFVLPCSVAFLWILSTRSFASFRRALYLPGILLALAIALPWVAAVSLRNPDFLWFFFVHEHFLRYSTLVADRYQPDWFFIPILLVGVAPWIGTFFVALVRAFLPLRTLSKREEDLFLLLWAGVIFLFFSFSKSKLVPYILPVLPPLSVLMGTTIDQAWDKADRKEFLKMILSGAPFLLLLAAAFCAYPFFQHSLTLDLHEILRFSVPLAAILIAAVILPWTLIAKRRVGGAVIALLVLAFSFGVALKPTMAFLAETRTTKNLALCAERFLKPDTLLVDYGAYDQGFAFYLKRRVAVVEGWGELEFGRKAEGTAASSWFLSKEDFFRLWRTRPDVIAFVRPDRLKDFIASGVHFQILDRDPYYYNDLILSNHPEVAKKAQ